MSQDRHSAGSVASAVWAAMETPDRQRTVLLVDDSPELLEALGERLKSAGYRVLKASSGLEAVTAYINDQSIDAVVIDLNMPDIDGGTVAQRLKFHRPFLPVVMFSGAERIPKEALRFVDALVQKGQSPQKLLAVLENLLPH